MFRRGKLAFLSTKDDRIKIINDRINLTEKHLIEMCTAFASSCRKMAKYRDSYDELAKTVKNYADEEEINESLSDGLKSFTNAVTILADYKDVQVHRMEVKIVNELALFENLCKTTRDQLRTAVIARDKEVLKQRQMLEIKSKFAANNTAADSELVKAKLEVNRTNKEIDDIICNFEKRKLADVKTILTDFILISMKYHTKVLEALSASYYDVSNIDEKSDFNEFQKLMKSKDEPQSRKLALKKGLRSQSMESLDRDQLLSPIKRRHRLSGSTKNLTGKTDDEQDEDEDDDDENEADSDENSNADEDDTVSGSDEEDNAEDVSDTGSDATKSNKTDLKKIKTKFQAKQTPKTTSTAAAHVFKTKSIRNQSKHKPFVGKGGGVGIPSTTNAKRNIVQFEDGNHLVTSVDKPPGTAASSRIVTVVESKKTHRKKIIDNANKNVEV